MSCGWHMGLWLDIWQLGFEPLWDTLERWSDPILVLYVHFQQPFQHCYRFKIVLSLYEIDLFC